MSEPVTTLALYNMLFKAWETDVTDVNIMQLC